MSAWLRGEDKVREKGGPSWSSLATALDKEGKHHIATNIRNKYCLDIKEVVELTEEFKTRLTTVKLEPTIQNDKPATNYSPTQINQSNDDQQKGAEVSFKSIPATRPTVQPTELDELKGVHVAAKNSFLIHGGSIQSVHWEEYGIRITIPQGAVLPSDTVQITIAALVGGDFIFPEDTELVSAVYAISLSKSFAKPVKLEIQHCVSIETVSHCKYLSFATAPSDKAPYQFKLVNGGNFVPNGGYGSIYVSEFCLWSLIQYVRTSISYLSSLTNKSYYGQVMREERRPGREWLIKFLLCKDLNALKEHINKEFKNNEKTNDLCFLFEEDNGYPGIEFCFDKPCPNGWSVKPYDTPIKVSQSEIDNYGSMSPPNFPQRLIEIVAKPGEGADGLNHPVTMRGIKSDIKKLNIVLTTVNTVIQQSLTPSFDPVDSPAINQRQLLNTSHLVDILDILKKHGYSGVSYYYLGLCLGLLPRTLNVIENERGDISSHFRLCLEKWLQQADDVKSKGGPTYDTLIQALRKMGENAVADGIERDINN
ncbi:PREDICTED: uncharacterized protein LOC109587727 [Amphimedon queenslandica]|nr:PREDICTED: uncharacterized protein LOC109587727 [Amphimedon queenslandica]|eukprot:XP_019859507.1 PREDICTED: uncharacterized protein LOC109587727 [Amphimedon queenslandica]